MKKNSTFALFSKMIYREVKSSWLQFLALFLIGAVAVTLFVGLLSNASTFEYQVSRAYEYGNCADLFLTTYRYQEEEENEIISMLNEKGEMDTRFEILGTASGKNSYLAVHHGLPQISAPYQVEYAEGYQEEEEKYCLVDYSLLEGRNELGTLKLGGELEFELPFATYLEAFSNLDLSTIESTLQSYLEEYPFLELLLTGMGVDLDDIFSQLAEEGTEIDFSALLSLFDREDFLISGGKNIFRENSLVLPFTITGAMKHPENVQLSAYQMTTILVGDAAMKESLLSLLEENFTGAGLLLSKVLVPIFFNWDISALFLSSNAYLTTPNQYLFTFDNSQNLDTFRGDLQSYFDKNPDNFYSLSLREEMPFAITMENDMQQARQFTFVFPFVFFAVALLIVLTTTGQLVIKSRIAIGTMKAIGIPKRAIYGYFLSIVLGIIFLAILLGEILGPFIVPSILGLKYDLLYSLPARVIIFPTLEALLAAFLFLLIAGVATYLMIRRDVLLSPAESMRPRVPKIKAKKTLLSKKKKTGTYLLSFKMAFRNMRLEWVRSLMTLVGTAGCTMLLVTGFGIEDTIHYGVNHDMTNFYDADFSLTLASGASFDTLTAFLEEIPAVEEVEPYLSLSLPVENVESSYTQEMEVRVPSKREDSTILLPLEEDSCFISQKSARELGVNVGDMISFSLEGKEISLPLTGIYQSFVFHGIILPLSHPALQGSSYSFSNVWVNISSSYSEEEGEEMIEEAFASSETLPSLIVCNSRATYAQTINDIMSSVYVMTNAVKVFAAILAIVSLYNLALLSFKERTRDIATLRVLGFSRREISSSLLWESLSLTFVGVLVGMGLGYPFLIAVLSANQVALVEYLYMIYPWTFLIAFGITFLLSFLVNLILSFRIPKVPMMESLKSVE